MILLRWHQAVTGCDCSGLAPEPNAAERIGIYRGVTRIARALKLDETSDPHRGDVGLFISGQLMFAGICTGKAWAARTSRGVGMFRDVKVHRAWVLA
jgi:hypothetical protein